MRRAPRRERDTPHEPRQRKPQQRHTAADIGFHQADKVFQMHTGHALFMVRLLVDQKADFADVAIAEQQQAIGLQAVAPGPPDLLIIPFDILRQIIVQYKADVGLINPHTKGDGGDHNLHIVTNKRVLIAPALMVGEAGVIRFDRKTFAG